LASSATDKSPNAVQLRPEAFESHASQLTATT
jgi:hypothetical protein